MRGIRQLRAAIAGAPDADHDRTKSAPQTEASSPEEFVVATGLPPEEFVLYLLEDAGGRLYQQEIMCRTGWPASTVSKRLAELESAGAIVRVQNGRENIVCLPQAAQPAHTSEPRGQ